MDTKEKIKEKLYEIYPIEKELSFDNLDLEDKIKNQLTLELKYWDLVQNETYKMDKLDDMMIDARFEVYDSLKFEGERTLTKAEIDDVYLPADKKIKHIKSLIELQKTKLDFFKMCYNSIKQQRWTVQSYIKNNGQM